MIFRFATALFTICDALAFAWRQSIFGYAKSSAPKQWLDHARSRVNRDQRMRFPALAPAPAPRAFERCHHVPQGAGVVSDRSGCGLIELAVLASLATLTTDDPELYVESARALARIENRIGLGVRYSYQVLRDLPYPWMMAVQLVAAMGDIGDRSSPGPAEATRTESR